ncbi:MAG TPA: DUF5924 family protein [Thermoanaerobaculaceae bacterium]|nr:DUF5924 family protein [Thermoanaerobaculaceae bacterium]
MEYAKPAWRVRLNRTADLGRQMRRRYARTFWMAHSAWALISGGIVLVLAHNRYGFLPWVVLFLTLTWLSTLFFSRISSGLDSPRARAAHGFVSYLTRVMYQETLFFLLPFYFYSTTFLSLNSAYVVVLALLAVLSCFDLPFDRLLRTNRWFAQGFFAFVTYSALQFFLPLLLHVRIHNGAYLAAGLSFFASLPLAYSARDLRNRRRLALIVVAVAAIVGVLKFARELIPPVPLRMTDLSFGTAIDPKTLDLVNEFPEGTPVAAATLAGQRLIARATIFSPGRLPLRVQFRFLKGGVVVKTSRNLDVVAHRRGFRVWDALRPGPGGLGPGKYRAEVWTSEGQLVGRQDLLVISGFFPEAGKPTTGAP